MRHPVTLVSLGLTVFVLFVTAQARGAAPDPAAAQEVMTNATVLELLGLGFGDAVILEKMSSSRCSFDLSIAGLRQLKDAKASDEVIAAMMKATKQQGAADAASNIDLNDPKAPHPAGIWLYEEVDGQPRMVQLDPCGFTQERTGGHFLSALTYGIAKAKEKGVIRGERANLRVRDGRPTFYFYFEVKNAGLSNTGYGAGTNLSSPSEFVLVETTVESGARQLVIGQANAYSAQSGALSKDVRDFEHERIADGVYRVQPRAPLSTG